MHKFIYHNDRLLPLQQVRLSPGQAGLINGWGLFTTVRTYNGQPFAFERHWNRLMTDAARIQIPVSYRQEYVREHLMELIEANHADAACVRIYFIHNRIGIWRSEENFPETDLIMYSIDVPIRVGPTKLALQPAGRFSANPLVNVKVTSWLNNAWIVEQAHNRGFDDAVVLNERGEVAECTAANIYIVKAGNVFTPPLSSGCLPGVSRQILLEIASQAGISIAEKPLTPDEVHAADEFFITSTTREVQPVSHLEEHQFPQAPGPVTKRLAKLFAEYRQKYIQENAARRMAVKA